MENNKELELLFESLDEKFRPLHNELYGYKFWNLHSWEFYGMSYGFELIYKNEEFTFRTLVDSGYNYGDKMIVTKDLKMIWNLRDCFAPTKSDFKTDRK